VQNLIIGREQMPSHGQLFTAGIHPWYIEASQVGAYLDELALWLRLPQCVGLGECGLDRLSDVPMDLQIEVFQAQMQLAYSAQKPVIVHCVRAFDTLLRLRSSMPADLRMVIHGYRKGPQLAEQLLAAGCHLSFGAYLQTANPGLIATLRGTPLDRLHLETDDSGASVESVYAAAAVLLGGSLDQLKAQMASNFELLYQRSV
jgi:TatD DNase family protein